MSKNIAIIGSSGAIGNAFVEHYLKDSSVENIYKKLQTRLKIILLIELLLPAAFFILKILDLRKV
jgi:hypothetical protein